MAGPCSWCHARAWCWEDLLPLLQSKGIHTLTLDLPGLGADDTAASQISMESYVSRVLQVIRSAPVPVTLLGHSMGGGPISQAAEYCPEQVKRLIYLAAFLPMDGECMIAYKLRQSSPDLTDTDTHLIDEATACELFYNECSPEKARAAASRLRPQALRPLRDSIAVSQSRFGAIPKTYIMCDRDRTLPLERQVWFCDRDPAVRRHCKAADHSPFYSAPDALAALLVKECE